MNDCTTNSLDGFFENLKSKQPGSFSPKIFLKAFISFLSFLLPLVLASFKLIYSNIISII